jgi:hypothetical protein
MHYKAPDNSVHFLDLVDHEYLLPAGSVQITDEEAEALRPVYTSTYAEKRAAEYPPIGDQLDALWKGGEAAAEMLAMVQAVKAKYPKVTP